MYFSISGKLLDMYRSTITSTMGVVFIFLMTATVRSQQGYACTEEQTSSLLKIRNSTSGFSLPSWQGNDCCGFEGIECALGVSGIELSRQHDSKIWYPNITLFTVFHDLAELGLSGSRIGGDLQAFCELKNLENLQWIDLSDNLLQGSIPICFGAMKSLYKLDLSNNQLTGNIPLSIFSNQTFGLFDVSHNNLQGPFPFSVFAKQSRLFYIDLSHNYNLEIETEFPSWVPRFSLNFLGLGNCNLNKKKNNHVVPAFISKQTNLQWLDLSHNSIEGNIPCWMLFSNRITVLFLRGNKFDSFLVGCNENFTSPLESLDISANRLNSTLPETIGNLFPALYHINISTNSLEGNIPQSIGALFLEILDLSNNVLSGEIPRRLTSTDSVLVYLNLSNNRLEGEMLPRDSNMTALECLYLGGNRFNGVISPAISKSSMLVLLDVRNNNLRGNIPNWLYDHPHLVAVLLGGNNIEGHIPRQIFGMETLQVLDLYGNNLGGGIPSCLENITFWKRSYSSNETHYFTRNGRLYFFLNPPGKPGVEFDVESDFLTKNVLYSFQGLPFKLMTGIDVSSNRLSGEIPVELGELRQLRSLNLSNNLLTGKIPTSFGNLKSMESLDLSHNNLTGNIPNEMAELWSLSSFSVAYNNLSGQIPSKGQFSTLDRNGFIGNPFLCEGECGTSTKTKPVEVEAETEEEDSIVDNDKIFYGFVALCYAFGFWMFFGVICFNKRWRQVYFSTLDRYI